MKLIANKRYKALLADSYENTAREITITNLTEENKKLVAELKKKDEYIKKLKSELRIKAEPTKKQGAVYTNKNGK